eukprot:10924286-Heterocapsa_arctica.AAC.1
MVWYLAESRLRLAKANSALRDCNQVMLKRSSSAMRRGGEQRWAASSHSGRVSWLFSLSLGTTISGVVVLSSNTATSTAAGASQSGGSMYSP